MKNIKEMDLTELKAIAYDLLANLQNIQNKLMQINNEIANKSVNQNKELKKTK